VPGRRHGPHARVHAALSRLTLAALVLTGLLGCGNGETPIDLKAIRFSGTIAPKREFKAYGEILPCEITIRNDGPVPVFLDRVEALSGRRRTLVDLTHPFDGAIDGAPDRLLRREALLFPGQSFTFLSRFRVLDPEERLLLRIEVTTERGLLDAGAWIGRDRLDEAGLFPYRADKGSREPLITPADRDPSKIHEGGAIAALDCPPCPFEPRLGSRMLEGWSFSTALGGFVLRNSGTDYRLLTEDGGSALPPLPFEFLDDVDYSGIAPNRPPTMVRTTDGEVVAIVPGNVAEFLCDVAVEGMRIRASRDLAAAKYEVVEE